MPTPLAITLHALASEAASGSAAPVDLGPDVGREALELTLDVESGTGSVKVESAPSLSGPWRQDHGFEPTGSREENVAIAPVGRYVRVSWTVTAGPLVFAVAGFSHVIYVRPADAFQTVPQKALEDVSARELARACIDTSAEAAGYFKRRYTMPLVAWGGDVRSKLGQRVAFLAMSLRGNQYEGPDETVKDNAKAAETWLMRVGSAAVHPEVTDSTPVRSGSGARVYSRSASCQRVGDEDC